MLSEGANGKRKAELTGGAIRDSGRGHEDDYGEGGVDGFLQRLLVHGLSGGKEGGREVGERKIGHEAEFAER